MKSFVSKFGYIPTHAWVAPGRVEGIGNHVDYQGGNIFAFSIDRYVASFVALRRPDATRDIGMAPIRMVDLNIDVTLDIHNKSPGIYNYYRPDGTTEKDRLVKGIIAQIMNPYKDNPNQVGTMLPDTGYYSILAKRDPQIYEKIRRLENGLDVVITGNVPFEAGVSSSAAFSVSLLQTLLDALDISMTEKEKIHFIKMAEHRSGAITGHLDQTVSLIGGAVLVQTEEAGPLRIKVDPRFYEYEYMLFPSGISHSLAGPDAIYPKRVKECDVALKTINTFLKEEKQKEIHTLAELGKLKNFKTVLPDIYHILPDSLKKRVRHIVEETLRVDKALECVQNGDVFRYSQLLNESGESSALLYEISHKEVEDLKHIIWKFFKEKNKDRNANDQLTYAARMMGGGDGGPVLVFLPKDKKLIEELLEYTQKEYYQPRGRSHLIPFNVNISSGPINLQPYLK
ncbi:hypothetical protein A3D77_01470 [Candidatus Gottesmanbacteria bacterium RIFCSPHIGHO2_02_FULL_39_11]|uniref:Galactokinase n=1 Tax=Candidatus Gottesmanbacteria bacterium RIFCSPHIGHO2_02_FULL_39_11 TaxID=1798382 RepID=A0A1F5ZT85_9BACT|nr:MAG: hypothetical protein A3D77_01470 [Candidatus Gottesmanbacteria bacterium RIFCSPHIGHO2_02_FULL_39_11]